MKRYSAFAFLIVLIALASCNAIKKLQQFYMEYNIGVVYPANLPAGIPLSIPSPPINTNSEQVFQKNSTSGNLIQSIKLNELDLTITSPSGQTFSFLDNVSVFLSTDSLPEVEIASKQSIPANVGSQLVMDLNNVELLSYLKSDKIKLRIAGTSNHVLAYNVNVKVHVKFFVQANVFAAL